METAAEFSDVVHEEDGAYWADVDDLPGCFASGETLDELVEALGEAIALYRDEPGGPITTVAPRAGAGASDPPETDVARRAASAAGLRIAVPA